MVWEQLAGRALVHIALTIRSAHETVSNSAHEV